MDGRTGGRRMLAVAAWQATMIRGPGLWALARRGPDGGLEVLCAGAARLSASLEAPRAPGWTAARGAGADAFLFVPGDPLRLVERPADLAEAA